MVNITELAGQDESESVVKMDQNIQSNQDFIDLQIRYFDSGILKDCKGIDDYSRNQIIQVLKAGIGRSLNWIVDMLTKEVTGLYPERARLIARTENVTASNYASYVQAAKTGLLMKKRWLSAKDGRVRNSHQIIDKPV